jgi:RNA polymerase sigma factor (sigma-70 family)
MHRAQAGDSEAYGVIVSRFQDMAYGYAYAVLNDFHLAQDAAQEAFVEAYQVLPSLREAVAFPAWFKRILHKHCDRLTRGKGFAVTPLEVVVGMASSLPGPAEEAERRELAERIQSAIQALPQEQRVVTALFYISGYSHQEIAAFLEVLGSTSG